MLNPALDSYDAEIKDAFLLSEGLTYFTIANLFSFDYLMENQQDDTLVLQKWNETIAQVCDDQIRIQEYL